MQPSIFELNLEMHGSLLLHMYPMALFIRLWTAHLDLPLLDHLLHLGYCERLGLATFGLPCYLDSFQHL